MKFVFGQTPTPRRASYGKAPLARPAARPSPAGVPAAPPVAAADAPPSAAHLETARKMGLNHPNEGLLIAPDRYEDYRQVLTDFRQIPRGADPAPVLCKVRVSANAAGGPAVRGFARKGAPAPLGGYKNADKCELHDPFAPEVQRLEVQVEDAHGNTAIQTIFGAFPSWRQIQAGQELVLRGPADRQFGGLRFAHAERVPPARVGTIVPVYLGAAGKAVNTDEVTALLAWLHADPVRLARARVVAIDAIRADCGGLDDAQILAACRPVDGMPTDLAMLLTQLHQPVSVDQGLAMQAVAARICALGLRQRARRANVRAACPQAPIGGNGSAGLTLMQSGQMLMGDYELQKRKNPGSADFTLTDNQSEVITAVLDRLQSDQPLNGLLNGEVGAGKTAAYAIPAVAAHRAGAKVTILAPTVLLANQIARTLETDFPGLAAIERVKAGGKIRNPDAILVGTEGLGSVARRAGYIPDFLVLDEQHKLQLAVREGLVAEHTHTLDVSATPVPRSMALSLYGGMDVFTLSEQPVQRDIRTFLIDVHDRRLANAALKNALTAGKRCAIVFTLVEPDEGTPAASLDAPAADPAARRDKDAQASQARALKTAQESAELFESHFPGQVALLHGKMKDAEKDAVLAAFRSGEKRLLITTTIFETGIDVPSIETLIVRDPQQLGLSQLHQLRGRLAREGGLGQCFLLTEDIQALSEDTLARLEAFRDTQDGYALALRDMVARGAGDLDGLQQKGRMSTTFKGIKLSTRDLVLDDDPLAPTLDEAISHERRERSIPTAFSA